VELHIGYLIYGRPYGRFPTKLIFLFLVIFYHFLIKIFHEKNLERKKRKNFNEKLFREKYFDEKKEKVLMRKNLEKKVLRKLKKKLKKIFLHPEPKKRQKYL